MNALVGYTGFVGSNLYAGGGFEKAYNSQNVEEAYGSCPELLVYSGVRAEKYLANAMPEKDREMIIQAERNIKAINPKKLVLISTIDVFAEPKNVDENSDVDTAYLHAYGADRYQLEQWVRKNYPDALIVRLPGLFGKNIKKNFIYDCIHMIPFMLRQDKMKELAKKDSTILQYYESLDTGFYRLHGLNADEQEILKEKFLDIGFSALDFTDSRSRYQFYNLQRLWKDIYTALEHGIRLFHAATEPVSAGELYCFLTGQAFVNELGGTPAEYDFRTIYDSLYGGKNGYICDKEYVLNDIRDFVNQYKKTGNF